MHRGPDEAVGLAAEVPHPAAVRGVDGEDVAVVRAEDQAAVGDDAGRVDLAEGLAEGRRRPADRRVGAVDGAQPVVLGHEVDRLVVRGQQLVGPDVGGPAAFPRGGDEGAQRPLGVDGGYQAVREGEVAAGRCDVAGGPTAFAVHDVVGGDPAVAGAEDDDVPDGQRGGGVRAEAVDDPQFLRRAADDHVAVVRVQQVRHGRPDGGREGEEVDLLPGRRRRTRPPRHGRTGARREDRAARGEAGEQPAAGDPLRGGARDERGQLVDAALPLLDRLAHRAAPPGPFGTPRRLTGRGEFGGRPGPRPEQIARGVRLGQEPPRVGTGQRHTDQDRTVPVRAPPDQPLLRYGQHGRLAVQPAQHRVRADRARHTRRYRPPAPATGARMRINPRPTTPRDETTRACRGAGDHLGPGSAGGPKRAPRAGVQPPATALGPLRPRPVPPVADRSGRRPRPGRRHRAPAPPRTPPG